MKSDSAAIGSSTAAAGSSDCQRSARAAVVMSIQASTMRSVAVATAGTTTLPSPCPARQAVSDSATTIIASSPTHATFQWLATLRSGSDTPRYVAQPTTRSAPAA